MKPATRDSPTTYARFGMAAPDGLMDVIPVTEQTGIYGRPNFSYRGVFDPLDFGFNDNDGAEFVAGERPCPTSPARTT